MCLRIHSITCGGGGGVVAREHETRDKQLNRATGTQVKRYRCAFFTCEMNKTSERTQKYNCFINENERNRTKLKPKKEEEGKGEHNDNQNMKEFNN